MASEVENAMAVADAAVYWTVSLPILEYVADCVANLSRAVAVAFSVTVNADGMKIVDGHMPILGYSAVGDD